MNDIPIRITTHPRARRLRLRFDPARQQGILTLPEGITPRQAQPFIDQHRPWLQEQALQFAPPIPFLPGQSIPLGDEDFLIQHAPDKPARVHVGDHIIRVGGPETGFEMRVENALKRLSRQRLEPIIQDMTARLGVRHRRITLRDTRSRWGSCSSKGDLSFSWRIIMAPSQVMEYLVAHEVSHLKELNHSAAFWAHVDSLVDHRRTSRRWLRTEGQVLFSYGAATP